MQKQSRVLRTFDLRHYSAINEKQAEFHKSISQNKLLIGGVGAGKTMPGIYESLFICRDNPGHNFAVFRNTWDSLEKNLERPFLEVAAKGSCFDPKDWSATKHILRLYNGTTIYFLPLGIDVEQIKGLNVCGFFIDDPDVYRFKNVITFMYTRMRDSATTKANYFESIICANWEGKNWLWQQYMRRKPEGGNGLFSYWVCPTQGNPTLPDGFVELQAATHSPEWVNRYVKCDLSSIFSGLVYNEYEPRIHQKDLSWIRTDKGKNLIKILVVDVGIGTGATVVLEMATNGKDLFLYGEWHKFGIEAPVLGEYLRRKTMGHEYRAVVIDPASGKTEQTSGSSVRKDLLRNYGVSCRTANNKIQYGIEVLKGLMSVRKGGITHFFIDHVECPVSDRQFEIYRWKEHKTADEAELAYREVPVDTDNDCMDTARYGAVYLNKRIFNIGDKADYQKLKKERLWAERRAKLPMYKQNARRGSYNPETERLRKIHAKGLLKV